MTNTIQGASPTRLIRCNSAESDDAVCGETRNPKTLTSRLQSIITCLKCCIPLPRVENKGGSMPGICCNRPPDLGEISAVTNNLPGPFTASPNQAHTSQLRSSSSSRYARLIDKIIGNMGVSPNNGVNAFFGHAPYRFRDSDSDSDSYSDSYSYSYSDSDLDLDSDSDSDSEAYAPTVRCSNVRREEKLLSRYKASSINADHTVTSGTSLDSGYAVCGEPPAVPGRSSNRFNEDTQNPKQAQKNVTKIVVDTDVAVQQIIALKKAELEYVEARRALAKSNAGIEKITELDNQYRAKFAELARLTASDQTNVFEEIMEFITANEHLEFGQVEL